jgi:TDG/mug DNA glycosylase family protein
MILPDLLGPGLSLVFIGTAAGARSARDRAYYAHPGNRFWRTLHETGLTPRRFAPAEYAELLELGVGLTDLCKRRAGQDHELAREDFDLAGLAMKLERHRPAAIAFTSKTAASVWFGVPTGRLACGLQPPKGAGPAMFVLPSPSGQAGGHFRLEPWAAAASFARAHRGGLRRTAETAYPPA